MIRGLKRIFHRTDSDDTDTPWVSPKRARYDIMQQAQPLPNKKQVANDSDGYVYEVDDFKKLERFLYLGTDCTLKFKYDDTDLLRKNAQCIDRLIRDGRGTDVVSCLKEASMRALTPKQHIILFALAICARSNDKHVKKAAYDALNDICRIPTHLFLFIQVCNNKETKPTEKDETAKQTDGRVKHVKQTKFPGNAAGWGRAHKRAISKWYEDQAATRGPLEMTRLLTKYRRRVGWSHKDVFRLAHIKPRTYWMQLIVCYFVKNRKEAEKKRTTHQENIHTEMEDIQKCIQELEQENISLKEKTTEQHSADNGDTQNIDSKIEVQKEKLENLKREKIHMNAVLEFLKVIDEAKDCKDENRTAELVRKHRLVREHVHPSTLKSKEVWTALAETMPMTARFKSLKIFTTMGILDHKGNGQESVLEFIKRTFTNKEELEKAKVHPFAILQAHNAYKQGVLSFHRKQTGASWYASNGTRRPKGTGKKNQERRTEGQTNVPSMSETEKKEQEKLEKIKHEKVIEKKRKRNKVKKENRKKQKKDFVPNSTVIDILNNAFSLPTASQPKSGKRLLVAIDANKASMNLNCFGNSTMTYGQVAAAFALLVLRVETKTNCDIKAFSKSLIPLNIEENSTLDQAQEALREIEPTDHIDCALPMLWAIEKKKKYDAFIVITSNQTYSGVIHPTDAVIDYRKKMKTNEAKLVVVAAAANDFTIADPKYANMLDVVGFDLTAFETITKFIAGQL